MNMLKCPVDFEEIKNRVTIEDILTDCGYRPSKNRMACPIHNGSNPTSFAFADHVFQCFSCGASGGLLDLTEALLDVDRGQALKYLAEKARIESKNHYTDEKQKPGTLIQPKLINIPDARLMNLELIYNGLEILLNHYTWQITDARKRLRNRKIDPPEYYALTQYAEYVLEELDSEVIQIKYEINVEKKRLRVFRRIS